MPITQLQADPRSAAFLQQCADQGQWAIECIQQICQQFSGPAGTPDLWTIGGAPTTKPIRLVVGIRHSGQKQRVFLLRRTGETTTVFYNDAEFTPRKISSAEPIAALQQWLSQIHARIGTISGQGLWPASFAADPTEDLAEETVEELAAAPTAASAQTPALNQILYGPPGTGKTYETIRAALQILDPQAVTVFDQTAGSLPSQQRAAREVLKQRFDTLRQQRKISFVTFHQSFSYEDFVEGLRATTDETSGQIRYEVVDGVFKAMCDSAAVKVTAADAAALDLRGKTVWKMSLGSPQRSDAGVFEQCITDQCIRLGYGEDIDFSGCRTKAEIQQKFAAAGVTLSGPHDYNLVSVSAFVTQMKTGDLVVVTDGNSKFRAIAEITGDYRYQPNPDFDQDYAQQRPVRWLRQYNPSLPAAELLNGNFMQKTLYALRSPLLDLQKLQQLLAEQPATAQVPDARVLIIDEINRGNISRIFGELITLIEPSKRAGAAEALAVTLPYSKQEFSVPANLYLIGTMNTADRSLAGLDLALRRRFTFREMPPKTDLLRNTTVEGVNVGALLWHMNRRISVLLDADHCIGHAYFMPLQTDNRLSVLANIFRQNILPLLQEYFFEDWERIRWVLNDQNKDQDHAFIVEDAAADLPSLFQNADDRLFSRPQWRLNLHAFEQLQAYRGILSITAPWQVSA